MRRVVYLGRRFHGGPDGQRIRRRARAKRVAASDGEPDRTGFRAAALVGGGESLASVSSVAQRDTRSLCCVPMRSRVRSRRGRRRRERSCRCRRATRKRYRRRQSSRARSSRANWARRERNHEEFNIIIEELRDLFKNIARYRGKSRLQ